jgi:hypothetical protein
MKKYKPVSVPQAAFVFCRYSIALLVWLSLILQSKIIMILVFIILLLSAIFKVQKAPMILLYSYTINKLIKSKDEILNEHAMRFAHTVGTVFSFICLVLLYSVGGLTGWIAVFCFALLKTISALGFCPASKLFECANNDSCCAFIKKHGR